MPQDKQLRGISLDAVVEKRRLDQALNAKEFAVLAGISYSTSRAWFRAPGFPVFRGVIFWQDFVQWRTGRSGIVKQTENLPQNNRVPPPIALNLPPRAARILREAL